MARALPGGHPTALKADRLHPADGRITVAIKGYHLRPTALLANLVLTSEPSRAKTIGAETGGLLIIKEFINEIINLAERRNRDNWFTAAQQTGHPQQVIGK